MYRAKHDEVRRLIPNQLNESNEMKWKVSQGLTTLRFNGFESKYKIN